MPFDIGEVIEVGEVLVILLQVPPTQPMMENVFGISKAGSVLWQIEKIPETSADPSNTYTGIMGFQNGMVRVGDWHGMVVDVDIQTGKVKQR